MSQKTLPAMVPSVLGLGACRTSTGDQTIAHQAEDRREAGRNVERRSPGTAHQLFSPNSRSVPHNSVSRLKLPVFFRPSSWLRTSWLSYFPDTRALAVT